MFLKLKSRKAYFVDGETFSHWLFLQMRLASRRFLTLNELFIENTGYRRWFSDVWLDENVDYL